MVTFSLVNLTRLIQLVSLKYFEVQHSVVTNIVISNYLVFCTGNNIVKEEEMPQFSMPVGKFDYKRIFHKSPLCAIGILKIEYSIEFLTHNIFIKKEYFKNEKRVQNFNVRGTWT